MWKVLAGIAGAMTSGFVVAAMIEGRNDSLILGAVVTAIAAVIFLGLDSLTSRKKVSAVTGEGEHSGGVDNRDGNIRNSNVAGRDLNITHPPPVPPTLPDEWWREENAPKFDIRPHASNGMTQGPNRLQLDIRQEGADVEFEGRWLGEGMPDTWDLAFTRNNPITERKYSIQGGTVFIPTTESGVVGFEIRLRWRGADCHLLWEYPYHLADKYDYTNLVLDTTMDNLRPVKRWRE